MQKDPTALIAQHLANVVLSNPTGITDYQLAHTMPEGMAAYVFRENNTDYYLKILGFLESANVIRVLPYFPTPPNSKFKLFPASYFLADALNDSVCEDEDIVVPLDSTGDLLLVANDSDEDSSINLSEEASVPCKPSNNVFQFKPRA